ncbi:TPA: hypothetical protein KRI65_003132 [Clostridioides difficile]|uniref:hypothetical protein n=1 Tax=Clostridioides difficile TaxID=1496 RepID=UPI0010BABF92|nr:hypothetical protein [Clostridioides difficile]VHX61478.1 Uncharacterised protein [Clostridioides difficile]HBE8430558.1 hypothetical protein [Clostridioides difficile]HBE9639131.1 hypothetical protein [Clostridioides difficile]HBF3044695.1 hypothetical protein [Clostridioides difficile]HBF4428969.1 hypothetical protein [Clostridioides difficile]
MQKKISEMSILEKADLISKKQKKLQEKYKNLSKGELFSIACNEVKKIEEQEGKYFEYR